MMRDPIVYLPRGWEEGFSDEGASYFIDHNRRTTSFRHPVTGEISQENAEFILNEQPNIRMSKQQADQRPSSMVSESSTAVTLSTMDTAPGSKVSRSSGRIHNFGKREQSIRRNPNAPVVVRGWLYKQDSSGMKLWKRRWFVLSEYCLFYYKDSREDTVLGSIPLPSYVVAPIEPEDHIGRKYAFKATHTGMRTYIYSKNSLIGSQAEHTGMRTYYFSADTQEDMSGWIRAMNQAALMQAYTLKRETGKEDRPLLAQSNHINVCKGMARAEGLQNKADSRRPDETFGFEKREEIKKEREDEERYGFRKDTVEMAVGKGGRKRAQASPTQSDEHAAHPQLLPRHHPAQRNGTLPPTAPSAGPAERNGGAVYRRGFVPRTGTEKNAQRKSSLAQVEQWVKYHKTDGPSLGPTQTLPHRTSQSQPYPDGYQTLPRNLGESSPPAGQHLPSDYKYAQDRVLHLKMSNNERQATKDGMVWQLYEWQQRQQFKHGSPTAPLYPPHDFEIAKATLDAPRSISVPPSPSDIPPPPLPGPPKALSPRRPHNPADRVTIRPQEGRATEVPFLGSPTKHRGPVAKTAAHVDRRSMPPMGYMMHTVSAPSLHGKTADDTYMQLKKNLEYLDLKVSLNTSTSALLLSSLLSCLLLIWSSPQDKLESVLEVTHTQMEQYRGQPTHTDKIAYQQRLLQEDLVQIRAEISIISTEMENVWKKYEQTERDVNQLKDPLPRFCNLMIGFLNQEQVQIRKDLRRIEDVMGGLSVSKSNYKVIMESIQNPDRRTVPSMPSSSVPSFSTTSTLYERRAANQLSPPVSPVMLSPGPQPQTQYRPHILPQFRQQPKVVSVSVKNNLVGFFLQPEDDAPPRPPLPHMYSPDDLPPAVPPLPKDATVIRHTSVRGLKRQSDERKRDREYGQYVNGDYKVKLRSYVSEPELMSVGSGMSRSMAGSLEHDGGFQTLPGRGRSWGRAQHAEEGGSQLQGRNDISSKRPKSAVERLYGENQRGRMSAEEQLERMKRHQKALVRERKRTLSHGERHSTSSRPSFRPASADIGSWKREQDFDLQLLERAAQGEASREHDGLLKVVPVVEADVEPLDYDLDLSKELSKPDMVEIPERYINLEPNEPLTNEELETRRRKVQKIKSILAKSSFQNVQSGITHNKENSLDVDLQLQEQERLITMSYALASEASQRSKLVAGNWQSAPWALVLFIPAFCLHMCPTAS
uniref:Pleckstrin homology domain containing A7 n=1 Tax=Callorhinchus milii TaxID=7868 RepID=A0A4W3JLB4_CALMI